PAAHLLLPPLRIGWRDNPRNVVSALTHRSSGSSSRSARSHRLLQYVAHGTPGTGAPQNTHSPNSLISPPSPPLRFANLGRRGVTLRRSQRRLGTRPARSTTRMPAVFLAYRVQR